MLKRMVVCVSLLVMVAGIVWAAEAPKLDPFPARQARVLEVMRKEQVDVAVDAWAVYDTEGKPVMTPEGRHKVEIRIGFVDLAEKQIVAE